MKKGVFIFIGVILFLIIILATCSNTGEKANKLYAEATGLVQEAKKIEEDNVNEALEKYVEAFNKIEKIINEHGKTKIASEIKTGEKKIGEISYTQLKEQVLPAIEEKANATKDLNSLLLYLLNQTEDSSYSKPLIQYEISKAYREANRYEEALKHLNNMEYSVELIPADKKYLKTSLLLMMGVEHYHHRNIETARIHIDNASILAQNEKATKLRERLILSVISAYAEISQFSKAERLLHKLSDEYLQDAAYFDITDNYAQIQQLDSAFAKANKIFAPDLKSRAFTNISEQLILQGREKTAEKYLEYCQDMLIDSIETQDKVAKSLIDIAECYHILGDKKEAEKLAKRIKKSIQDVENYHISNQLNVSYALLSQKMGNTSISTEMLEGSLIIAEAFPKNSSLEVAHVAIGFAKAGQFTRAFQAAQKIESKSHRLETLVKITTLQMKAKERISKSTAFEIQKIIQL